MTGFQALAKAPDVALDLDPYRFPAVFMEDRYEETSTACGSMEFGDYSLPAPAQVPSPAPAPAPSSRPSIRLAPADRRRLDLHAALTAAGIAPLPGDLHAIDALCTLDDTTHIALQRWLGGFGNS
ncbi:MULTISPECIES: hypothetical protein [Streptomyces]|uniref:hypothetical protein n=1 Tax=Streptomyces TaxID=1883 RepID=UPI0019A38EB4|nr:MULTISPECIES: hypothetical protein [Streptomyces]GGT80401.1 hypothetical protein GCM10010272_26000 [Streptomyces lateritius]